MKVSSYTVVTIFYHSYIFSLLVVVKPQPTMCTSEEESSKLNPFQLALDTVELRIKDCLKILSEENNLPIYAGHKSACVLYSEVFTVVASYN